MMYCPRCKKDVHPEDEGTRNSTSLWCPKCKLRLAKHGHHGKAGRKKIPDDEYIDEPRGHEVFAKKGHHGKVGKNKLPSIYDMWSLK